MKRLFALFLALAMIMTCTACGGQKKNADTIGDQSDGKEKYRLGIIMAQGGLGDRFTVPKLHSMARDPSASRIGREKK